MLQRFLVSLLSSRRDAAQSRQRSALLALQAQDWPRAAAEYEELLRHSPEHAEAWNDYGIVLQAQGWQAQAGEAFGRAISIDPDLAAARLNLGHVLFEGRKDYQGAEEQYRRALSIDPGLVEAHRQLGLVLYELGRVEEAIDCFRRAQRLAPDDPTHQEYCLFATNADRDHAPDPHFEDHIRWAGTLERHAIDPVSAARGAARLRVGYVSGDFREHATASFVLPILEGHDRSAFEVYCYANLSGGDEITDRIKTRADSWIEIGALTDREAAEKIRSDGVDILVDLSGHTRGNRLGVFACRPARVQVTYLGYLNTTGLKEMDYRLTDASLDPPKSSDPYHVETLLRLRPTCWCFRAPENAPPAGNAPLLRTGQPTFGSFNHIAKLNDEVLRLWAEILCALPGARLVCAGVPDERTESRISERFLHLGIGRGKLGFLRRLDRRDYFDALSQVDICLDPFPYNGGATTCEALWMGVPVLTLAGDFGFARSAASLLIAAGLDEFVTTSPRAYKQLAIELATVPDRIAGIRRGLRERMRTSALMDERQFIGRLETCYQSIVRSNPRCS